MAGLLQDDDMDQLEQWIGGGPKQFNLLYSITRDGCNATTFHQKCDNQGPTVTVLYNQQGSIYGGYTGISWTSYGDFQNDDTAFLYQLKYNRQQTKRQFMSNRNGHFDFEEEMYGVQAISPFYGRKGRQTSVQGAKSIGQHIYCHPNYGPTFGANHDLHAFSGNIANSGGYYKLNGSINIGRSYSNLKEIGMNKINNGTMNVTELEVYLVTDRLDCKRTTPKRNQWRKTQTWNEKYLDDLQEDIMTFKPMPDLDVSEARILMIGPVGAGKSSFYNTINSIFRGRITQKAGSGCAEQSLTTAYTPYNVRARSGGTLNFRLCDTRGLEESQGIDIIECNYLLDGNVPEYYQFNPATPITQDADGFVSKPTMEDKIHCVVFVLDSTTLEALPTKILHKMKSFQTLMNQKGIPQAVLLTKVDNLCKEVEKNVADVFLSSAVEKHVEKASQLLGLPRGNVLPVKNYENEMQLENDISILSLLSLRQILNFAEDYLESVLDKMASSHRRKERREKSNVKK